MKAAVATSAGGGFTTMEVTLDNPQGHEVLVDVKASGLCHTDHGLMETGDLVPLPAVLGHEIAGVVLAVGPEVRTIAVGDHVAACAIQFCGTCRECTSGRTFACLISGATVRTDQEKPRLSLEDGTRIEQGVGVGGFAEQALVHENQLAVINREIPFPQAALLGCGVATGIGSVINAAGVRVGDTVAVIGTGGVGLNVISGALIAGAVQVIAIDINPAKLAVAKEFGATHAIDSSKIDPVEAVRALTDGGVDHVFEVTGLSVTQEQAVNMRRKGGASYLIGVARPGTTLSIDSAATALGQHTHLETVSMGSTNLKRDLPLYADLYVQGRLNLDALVSNEIHIDQVNEAYEALLRGEVIRSVITSF